MHQIINGTTRESGSVMDPIEILGHWYQGDDESETGIAGEAFRAAREHLKQTSSLSDKEKCFLDATASVEDVEQVVAKALAKYEAKNESSKARKWLQRLSETICHYGNILDVFVQHHPEYVSLVWGTMKLLFTSVVNHTETFKLLAKSTCQVTLCLPRVKVMSILYPTERMRLAIENLYSCILEFLLMAQGWCNESKFQHIYRGFTRPHELRFDDLLERISNCSNSIIELATIGSHVEIRVMHKTQTKKLQDVISMLEASDKCRKDQVDGLAQAVSRLEIFCSKQGEKLDIALSFLKASGITISELLEKTEAFHSIHTSAQLNTNQQLSDLELSQVLGTFQLAFDDPNKCYEHHLFFRKRRAIGRGVNIVTNDFWRSPTFTNLSSRPKSTMVIVKGGFMSRTAMQDFSVDLIQALTTTGIPTIWALASGLQSRSNSIHSVADMMKYLIYQVLRLRGAVTTEKQIVLRHSQLHTSQTERELLDLFEQVVSNLGGQLYIILDLATVKPPTGDTDGTTFFQELHRMIREISKQPDGTKVKIILLVYESDWSALMSSKVSRHVVAVKTLGRKRPQGNARRPRAKKHFL